MQEGLDGDLDGLEGLLEEEDDVHILDSHGLDAILEDDDGGTGLYSGPDDHADLSLSALFSQAVVSTSTPAQPKPSKQPKPVLSQQAPGGKGAATCWLLQRESLFFAAGGSYVCGKL